MPSLPFVARRRGLRTLVVGVVVLGASALLFGVATAGASTTATVPSSFVGTSPVTLANGVHLAGGDRFSRTVTGVGSVPRDVTAVQIGVDVVSTTARGALFVFPRGSKAHGVPALRWGKGQSVSGSVTVPVAGDRKVVFENQNGAARIRARITGFFIPSRLPSVLESSSGQASVTRDGSQVGRLTLPAGNFLVTATTSVSSATSGLDNAGCFLRDAAFDDNAHNFAQAFGSTGFVGDISEQSALSLQAVVTSAAGETVILVCSDDGGNGTAVAPRITAVEVGTVTGS